MKKLVIMAASLLAVVGCTTTTNSTNPFLQESYGTPHEIPPFDKITIDNYREAILKGIEEEKAEINAIVVNRATPDFENTILAMEESGKLLSKAQSVFSTLNSSDSNEEKRALQTELSPLLTAH
ncbi:MAG: peptidase M3, partial [Bacteroidales bacterium]|nr:peptidase M3 [Bacteroidales bacterium]